MDDSGHAARCPTLISPFYGIRDESLGTDEVRCGFVDVSEMWKLSEECQCELDNAGTPMPVPQKKGQQDGVDAF
jgi:hypothetical protein